MQAPFTHLWTLMAWKGKKLFSNSSSFPIYQSLEDEKSTGGGVGHHKLAGIMGLQKAVETDQNSLFSKS